MLLNLIKEAQILSTLDQEKLAILQETKKLLGKDTLYCLFEAFRPTPADYTKWLSVIVGYAKDNKVSLKRKTDFEDVAYAVLENDPANPPEEVKRSVVNKLWLDHKSSKHYAAIEQSARAQEEEEDATDRMRGFGDNDSEHEQGAEDHFNQEQDDEGQTNREPGENDISDEHRDERDALETCPHCGKPLYNDDDDSAERGQDDPGRDETGERDDEFCRGDEDCELSTSRVGGAEKIGSFGGHVQRSEGLPSGYPYGEENEERSPMTAKSGEEVKPKQAVSLLQQMLTRPKEHINQAIKDVEAEGAAAWKAHQVPANPHPEKSMAFKAWERGMKTAAKTHFGLDEKPTVSTSKHRRK